MSIDRTMNPKTCAPAERDVSGSGTRDWLTFRSYWSEEESFGCRVFYKHYVPTGRGDWRFSARPLERCKGFLPPCSGCEIISFSLRWSSLRCDHRLLSDSLSGWDLRYRARFGKLSGGGAFGLRLNLRVQVRLVVACDVITLIIIVVMRLNTQVVKHHTQDFRAHVL